MAIGSKLGTTKIILVKWSLRVNESSLYSWETESQRGAWPTCDDTGDQWQSWDWHPDFPIPKVMFFDFSSFCRRTQAPVPHAHLENSFILAAEWAPPLPFSLYVSGWHWVRGLPRPPGTWAWQGSGSPLRSLLSSESAELVQRGKGEGREESKEGKELGSPRAERAPRAGRVEQELGEGRAP